MADNEQEGYDACYDGFRRNQNPHSQASDAWGDWDRGYGLAQGEIEQENWDDGDRDDYESGRWTNEDERSMNAGRDIPLRNEAGEWMV